MRPARSWHLVTGEYPPQPGGVSDYTALLAAALAAEAVPVHVWCPGAEPAPQVEPGGVVVHRVAGRFGPAGLANLDRELNRIPSPRTIVLQYAPHAFGWKAMNVPFALWGASRRMRGDDLRVMFHEVTYPWVRRPLQHNILAAVNRLMAAILLRACTRAYISIPGWIRPLKQLGMGRKSVRWLPIPSTIPGDCPPESVLARREEVTARQADAAVVGHFGTYGDLVTTMLEPAIRALLEQAPRARVLLLGGPGIRWRAAYLTRHPGQADRIVAPGPLSADALAGYLRACDLMLQPYPDGASTRRTTLMAALANGAPVVTTTGALSEPVWEKERAVAIAAPHELAAVACRLLNDPPARATLGRRGRDLYERRFAIRYTVAALLELPNAPG